MRKNGVIVKSSLCLLLKVVCIFEVLKLTTIESAIEKLQPIVREKEAQRSEHKQRQEDEVE